MSATSGPSQAATGPVLLCYDGSEDARAAIAAAGEMLGRSQAEVLVVAESIPVWSPSDPGAVLSATVSKLASHALGFEEIGAEVAQQTLEEGLRLAEAAGFTARGRTRRGKPWRVICQVAADIGADPIVLGACGLGRVQSALLGSVSAAVVTHAHRPVLVIPLHRAPALAEPGA